MFKNREKPNVLLVGSAKAGTTAIYSFLCQHKKVELPSRKEPKFLTYASGINKLNGPGDHRTINRLIKKESDYAKLYTSDQNILSIDGSVDNLYYYEKVIPTIKEKLGDVKIVICLRDPVKRAFSAYSMQVRDQRETLSFEDALAAEDERIMNNYEFIWFYKHGGLYYKQVKAYLDSFTNVRVILIEDFRENPKKEFDALLDFLNLDKDYDIDFSKTPNKTVIPRSKFLHKILVLSDIKNFIASFLSASQRQKLRNGILKKIVGYDELTYEGQMSSELASFFEEDVKKLSKLLKRDLKQLWLDKYL